MSNDPYLQHHGILGMHWGIRRYQPYPKGYSGKGKEVGEARNVQQESDGEKYDKREVAKLRTEAEALGKKAIITVIGATTGITIGMITQNPIVGASATIGSTAIAKLTPLGRVNVYFKKK